MEPEDPALAIAARHALHDEELIAAYATDGDAAEDAARAKGLVERCAACRELHDDLVTIGAVLRAAAEPEAVSAIGPAPRDFRLSVARANELVPGSVVLRLRDRVLAALRSFGRPMGMSLATLGVVGLFLGTLTLGGGATLTPAAQDAGTTGGLGAAASSAPDATRDTALAPGEGDGPASTQRAIAGTTPAPAETAELTSEEVGGAAGGQGGSTGQGGTGGTGTDGGRSRTSTGVNAGSVLLIGLSAVALVAGVALFLAGSRGREPIPGR